LQIRRCLELEDQIVTDWLVALVEGSAGMTVAHSAAEDQMPFDSRLLVGAFVAPGLDEVAEVFEEHVVLGR